MPEPFTHEPYCIKCDTIDTRIEIHQVIDFDVKEFIVTCQKCGYVWKMDTADAKGGADATIPKKD